MNMNAKSDHKRIGKEREQATRRFLFPLSQDLDRSLPRSPTQAGLIAHKVANRLVGKGSCFFISVARVPWCVTARHVICDQARDAISIENRNGLFVLVGSGANTKSISLNGRHFFAHGLLDMAAFPLGFDEAAALGSVIYPIPRQTVVDSLAWSAVGFPGKLNIQGEGARQLDRSLARLFLYGAETLPTRLWNPARSPADFRAFQFHQSKMRSESGDLIKEPDIRGMSGSPVLGGRLDSRGVNWCLEGMLMEYHASEERAVMLSLSAIVRTLEELVAHVMKRPSGSGAPTDGPTGWPE